MRFMKLILPDVVVGSCDGEGGVPGQARTVDAPPIPGSVGATPQTLPLRVQDSKTAMAVSACPIGWRAATGHVSVLTMARSPFCRAGPT